MSEQGRAKQAWRRGAVLCLLLAALPLAACGKKPGQLDPPPGAGRDMLMQTYPDPATDPKP